MDDHVSPVMSQADPVASVDTENPSRWERENLRLIALGDYDIELRHRALETVQEFPKTDRQIVFSDIVVAEADTAADEEIQTRAEDMLFERDATR